MAFGTSYLQKAFSRNRAHFQLLRHRPFRRNFASESPKDATSRFERVNSRLPRFLQRYTTPLRNAPLSSIIAFLLLHELTAIVPLFGLAATFHYSHWLPPYISEGRYVSEGVEKFGNYFRRKGWLGEEEGVRGRWWGRGEGGVRVVVEFATAWAITKALLPLRLIVSVSATPWFARVAIIPFTGAFGRLFRRKPKVVTPIVSTTGTNAAGMSTGASGAGVLPKKSP